MIDNTQSFRFFNRGPSPLARLFFFVVLSLLLLFIDARYRYLETTRSALSILVSPIQKLAAVPGALWSQLSEIYITQGTQHQLIDENSALNLQHQLDAAQLLQLQDLQIENQRLRQLADLPIRNEFTAQLAELIYVERNVFQRKVLVNKGADAQVKLGQVVMDDVGIVGQITRVYPWLSEVTLITEKDHAVPVQIQRNGIRTILFGSGNTSQLSLRYMPISADILEGDLLVTSGIDGLYPAGIPVAKVVKIERDPVYPFARVSCLPLAGVDKHRHLLILSSLPDLPERPESAVNSLVDKRSKIRKKQ